MHAQATTLSRLESLIRRIVACGALLVLALPAARGSSAWFGALPLWLLGMPLVAWWSLHRFRLPQWPSRMARARRRPNAQARRRAPARRRVAWMQRAA
ncbi:hypothetical protein [Dyella sp.]|uniref:hypothetical protein n=1 Tax=Dyella sp. TaxID=1869338 RepID=UPI002D7A3A74|nr:hypothetical protein [Dyella sp.]HET6430893.1 hypothetical protein [Dyella sp.]